jgi:exodeoxyribonuclease VII small subunit
MNMSAEPPIAFEAALEELERIVDALESGDATLAEALARYERGIKLLAHCHGLLDGAERTVALLSGVDADGQPVMTPFDTTATADKGSERRGERPAP